MNAALKRTLEALLGDRVTASGEALVAAPQDERELSSIVRTVAAQGAGFGREVVLSRRRLSSVGPVEPKSGLILAGAGARMSGIETVAQSAGLTLGPLSPGILSLELSTFLEGRWGGMRGIPGGRLEPIAVALRALLPSGEVYGSRQAPRSAAGPDLDGLVLGGAGQVALVLSASLRLFPAIKARRVETFSFSDAAPALRALRLALSDGCWMERVHLARRGDRRILEVSFVGTADTVERDGRTLADRAFFSGGRSSGHRLQAAPQPAGATEVEAAWDAVAASVEKGAEVTLFRLSLESVIAQGDVEGVALTGGPARPDAGSAWAWSAVLEAVDPHRVFAAKAGEMAGDLQGKLQ